MLEIALMAEYPTMPIPALTMPTVTVLIQSNVLTAGVKEYSILCGFQESCPSCAIDSACEALSAGGVYGHAFACHETFIPFLLKTWADTIGIAKRHGLRLKRQILTRA
jgi:hypothetical protein